MSAKRTILSETKVAYDKGQTVVAYHPRHQPEPMLATVTERFSASIPSSTYVKVQFANGVEATTHYSNVGPAAEAEWNVA